MVNQKLVINSNYTTLVIYQNGNVQAKGGYKKRMTKAHYGANGHPFKYTPPWDEKEPYEAGKYQTKNYKQRKKSRRDTLKELAENNFKPKKCLFITLTFDPSTGTEVEPVLLPPELAQYDLETSLMEATEDLFSGGKAKKKEIIPKFQDLPACHAEFKKFIQRMNYRYDNFKYVAVYSRQGMTGVWHYHMICNLRYIPIGELNDIWGLGVSYIKSVRRTGAMYKTINYCIRNMLAYADELKGEKGYLNSRGLNRNIVLRSWIGAEQNDFQACKDSLDKQRKNGLECSYKRVTEHRYIGKRVSEDGIFVEEEERLCKCKYYTYPVNSAAQFDFVVATRKEKKA